MSAPPQQQQQPPQQQQPQSDQSSSYKAILEYLNRRGHTKAASLLAADLSNGTPSTLDSPAPSPAAAAAGGGKAVGLEDFAERNAPSAARGATPGTATPGGAGAGAAAPGQQRRRPDQAVAGGQLLADPPSWEKGYEGLRTFVENSLDIHRPELHPLLLPLFVHSYLDLVLVGYRDAADQFLLRFASDHKTLTPHIVPLLSSIRLPQHLSESEEATRWRQERYNVRLSERGWGLLLGWLQGGGLAGSIEGTEARGRDRVLAIINERVKVDAVPGPPTKIATEFGLTSDFQGKRPIQPLEELKLGPAPIDPKLSREVARLVKDEEDAAKGTGGSDEKEKEGGGEGGMAIDEPAATTTTAAEGGATESTTESGDAAAATTTTTSTDTPVVPPLTIDPTPSSSTLPDLISPYPAELPPYPSTLRTIDVMREVEKVREARKRIKLGAEAYVSTNGTVVKKEVGGTANGVSGAAKPSVCLFTVHDAGESLTTTAFSDDSTLLAAGFSESYIRIWSLKGGQLVGMRNDFDSDEVHDANDLKSLRLPSGPTTRKLIGHSGPIYSLSFDPVPGPSSPPRYLLSSSSDSTIRLWSLETWTNLVVYRGHREPVWEVTWGPRGIYFATASRDRTARLWSSDKTSALRIFAGHLSDVNCVTFHPNSLYLATGSSDRTCRLWDVQKGTCVRVFVGHRGTVMKVAISPDGRWLASASEDLTINLWDLTTGRLLKTMTGHTSSIHSLSFSIESTVLVSGSSDSTVRVWDIKSLPPSIEDELVGGGGGGGGGVGGGSGGLLGLGGGGMMGGGALGGGKKTKSFKEVRELARKAVGGGSGGVGGNGGKEERGLGGTGAGGKREEKEVGESFDLLATLATKRTPVLEVKFTNRNLCLAAGGMLAD